MMDASNFNGKRDEAQIFYDIQGARKSTVADSCSNMHQRRKLQSLEAKEIANQRSQAFNYLFSKYET